MEKTSLANRLGLAFVVLLGFTMPALLAGLWVLLAMLNVLNHYNLDELRELAKFALPDHATRPP